MHESQSRLWENLIGRSRAFWDHYYPLFRQTFPEQTEGVSQEAFYHASEEKGACAGRNGAGVAAEEEFCGLSGRENHYGEDRGGVK